MHGSPPNVRSSSRPIVAEEPRVPPATYRLSGLKKPIAVRNFRPPNQERSEAGREQRLLLDFVDSPGAFAGLR
jgi:hypothetical protein